MPDNNSYDRGLNRSIGDRPTRTSSSGPQPGISRSSTSHRASSGATHPANSRPAGSRPANSRPAGSRPAGSRPSNAQQGARPRTGQSSRSGSGRPSQGNRRTQPRRKRKPQPRFYAYIAGLAVVLVLAIVGITVIGSGGSDKKGPQELPTTPPSGGQSNATILTATPDPNAPEGLEQPAVEPEEEEQDNAPKISIADQVQISPEQLMVNTSLPSEWLNVLLLGTDERWLDEPARTDTMIIASINTTTGAVKLTSLLRDTAVTFDDLPKNNGTYRLNAANYFGGPLYAIKTINQLLNMNIQYYAAVNFYGFTRIAEALGGIDVDITEAEMNEINRRQVSQAVVAATVGVAEDGIANEILETYGPNTHLNGRQTLAYARIRHVDNDYARTERQRTVIQKLTAKLRGKSIAEIVALIGSLAGNVTTNMDLNTAATIAYTVLSSGLTDMDTLLLPRNDTYKLERRNNQEMFYDTDWKKNQELLYNFIYT